MTETASRNRHEYIVAAMSLVLLALFFGIIGYDIFEIITTGHLPNGTTPLTTFDYIFQMIKFVWVEMGIGCGIIFVVASVKNSRS